MHLKSLFKANKKGDDNMGYTRYMRKRQKVGLSQVDMANKLGIDYKQYIMIERGKVKMPQNLIDKFNDIIKTNTKTINELDTKDREILVNEWWHNMMQRDDNGVLNIRTKMKEFNINSISRLGYLLGYASGSTLSTMFAQKDATSFNVKNKVYSFFENELNIQPPKDSKYRDWYNDFDSQDWYNKSGLTIRDITGLVSLSPNTVRSFVYGNPSDETIKIMYKYIKQCNKTEDNVTEDNITNNIVEDNTTQQEESIEMILTPIDEKDVPQEIVESVNTRIDELKQEKELNTIKDKLIDKYTEKLKMLDFEIDNSNKTIIELTNNLEKLKEHQDDLIKQQSIYGELLTDIENMEV